MIGAQAPSRRRFVRNVDLIRWYPYRLAVLPYHNRESFSLVSEQRRSRRPTNCRIDLRSFEEDGSNVLGWFSHRNDLRRTRVHPSPRRSMQETTKSYRRLPSASSLRRSSMIFPAVSAAPSGANADNPEAITSAFTNRVTPSVSLSSAVRWSTFRHRSGRRELSPPGATRRRV